MTKLLTLPDEAVLLPRVTGFSEDFHEFVTGDLFTDTSEDTGAAVAAIDGAGGQVTLTTGGTDNNECYLHTTKELFLFAADKPIFAEARLKFAEANTDDANVAFGLMNAVGANSLVDNGGGPKADYSGLTFYKVDGETLWNVEASIGTAQTGTTLLNAANSLDKADHTAGGGTWQTLRIEWQPTSATSGTAAFFIDGVHVRSIDFTFTNATEMMAFVGVKAGGANSEVVTVDYIRAYQLR